MEEMSGPGLRQFFLKILNSIAWVLLWAMSCATAGIYFQLGIIHEVPVVYTIIFYTLMISTLLLLIRHLISVWRKE